MSVEIADRASSARLLLDDPVVTEALAAIEREAFEAMLEADISTTVLGANIIIVEMQAKVHVVRAFKDHLEQAVSKAVASRRRPPAVA